MEGGKEEGREGGRWCQSKKNCGGRGGGMGQDRREDGRGGRRAEGSDRSNKLAVLQQTINDQVLVTNHPPSNRRRHTPEWGRRGGDLI